MKTIDEIMNLMTGKGIIADLADLLRANDDEFAESEKKYLAAVESLRAELPTDYTPALDEYLNAYYFRCRLCWLFGFPCQP